MLVLAVPADRVRAVERDASPERVGHGAVAGFARQLAVERRPDRLRDLGVGVEAVERVLAARQRVEHSAVVEQPREPEVLGVAGHRVESGQHVLHAAELGLEHGLPLCVAEPRSAGGDPGRHAVQRLQRGRVAGRTLDVEQACHDLVQRVVGSPDVPARLDALEELLRERGQVAVAHPAPGQCQLHPAQLADDGERPRLQPLVARGLVHQRARGQIVAQAVATQLDIRRFPAAVRLRARRQAGVPPERVQQPVRVELHQVVAAAPLRVEERPGEDPDVAQGKPLELRAARAGWRASIGVRARIRAPDDQEQGQRRSEAHAGLSTHVGVGARTTATPTTALQCDSPARQPCTRQPGA